ncbi:MAG: helix-turn-helix domain-containing protein [Bacteroidota bacterium]
MKFNIYQLVLAFGLLNGILLLITLTSLPKRYRKPTRFLGLFIVGYVIYVSNWTIFASLSHHYDFPPLWIPTLYFLPALTYFFTQSIVIRNDQLSTKEKWFLLPGILDGIYQLVKWIIALRRNDGYYFPLDDRTEFFIYEGLGIAFGAFCLYQIYLLTKQVDLKKNSTYKFYRFAFYFLVFVLLRWMVMYLIDLFQPSLLSFELQFSVWVIDLACFFFLGYRNLVAPNKYSIQLPSNHSKGSLSESLIRLMEEKKPYLDQGFHRRDLAELMSTSEERISSILNNELEVSFYELVNTYRVEEARRFLDEGAMNTLTMEAIAHQAGFKSKTTFYKFFKGQFGIRPSDYIKSN